jgi:hypothetical protein
MHARRSEEEIKTFSSKSDPFDFHTEKGASGDSIFGSLAASDVHRVYIFNRLCDDVEMLAVFVQTILAHLKQRSPPGVARGSDSAGSFPLLSSQS